jgi:hypothetical protein
MEVSGADRFPQTPGLTAYQPQLTSLEFAIGVASLQTSPVKPQLPSSRVARRSAGAGRSTEGAGKLGYHVSVVGGRPYQGHDE